MVKTFKVPLIDMMKLLEGDKETIAKYNDMVYKKCEVCGKTFTVAGRSDQTVCSQSCTTARWQMSHPEQNKKLKRDWYLKKKATNKIVNIINKEIGDD